MTRIAIFASGAGSNAARIIDYFRGSSSIKVSLIICNKPDAGVLNIAKSENISFIIIDKELFFNGDAYLSSLKEYKIGFIVLAGFLWKIPLALITAYPNAIINIHPALLPAFGGKGMYGMNVHEAVIHSGEPESGITIHYVDEQYDNGDIIYQQRFSISPLDTPATLAQKIHTLEHINFPRVIEEVIQKQKHQ